MIESMFYKKISNNEYAIKKVQKDKKMLLKEIVIPNNIIEINENAFKECINLEILEFSKSVKQIKEGAFSSCTNLDKVYYDGTIEDWCNITFKDDDSNPMYYANHFYIKNSSNIYEEITEIEISNMIKKIGNYQFAGFNNITKITISDSVTAIENFAFQGCSSLTNITIPLSVTSIGKFAFSDCTSLTNIKIPNSVISIEMCAFLQCNSLTSIEIPNSVENIGYCAFEGCYNLKMINVNKDNKKYVSIDGNLYSYDQKVLLQYAIGKKDISFEIPNCVTKLEDYSFYKCSSIESIIIPSSVTSIGDKIFYGCSSLTSIEILSSVTSIGESVFYGCSNLTTIYVDCNNKNYVSVDGNLYSYDQKTLIQYAVGKPDESFIIPSSVISIGGNAFSTCTNLKSIIIPDSVNEIEENAFFYCNNLTIYCEAKSKPESWDIKLNNCDFKVVWNYVISNN